jgi:hypothetical protein
METRTVTGKFLKKKLFKIYHCGGENEVLSSSDVMIYHELVHWETLLLIKPTHPVAMREMTRLRKEHDL